MGGQRHLCRKTWYPVALTGEVSRAPRAFELLGVPYVMYRSQSGQPVVHLDRCPHRNVPLSEGRCRSDDTIECRYHGWRFAPGGTCVKIPGCAAAPKPTHRVETFATCEKHGFVWMCPDEQGEAPAVAPLDVPEASDPTYTKIVRRAAYPGGLQAVIENALDVPHTAVLHQGLFRSDDRRKEIDVVLRRYRTWAEAEFVGETPPRGIMGRLLTLGSKGKQSDVTLEHFDRFVLPSVLQVEYRIGTTSHFLITGFCSPISDTSTELFALVCLKTPLPRFIERLLTFVVEPFAWKVVAQDVHILKAQTKALERLGGERYMSTEIDVLGSSIARLLKDASDREAADPADVLDTSSIDRDEEPRDQSKIQLLV